MKVIEERCQSEGYKFLALPCGNLSRGLASPRSGSPTLSRDLVGEPSFKWGFGRAFWLGSGQNRHARLSSPRPGSPDGVWSGSPTLSRDLVGELSFKSGSSRVFWLGSDQNHHVRLSGPHRDLAVF